MHSFLGASVKKQAKARLVGFSVGLSALVTTVLAVTPAAATTLHPVAWYESKSAAYCGSLPTRTAVQQMQKAACDSARLASVNAMTQAQLSGQYTATELMRLAASKNWPGV